MGTFLSSQFGGSPRTECAALDFIILLATKELKKMAEIALNLEKHTGRMLPIIAMR